jgi:hypothetical protein
MPKSNKMDTGSRKAIGMEENSLQILMKEYDALREMYAQAERNGQTMFNYYLTLMTATFGGVALVFQPSSGIVMQKTLSGLLFIFFAVIGSLYLSSLSTNSAHMTRYARGINEIRRLLIERFSVPVPPIYSKFISEKDIENKSNLMVLFSLFIPVNTFELFVATVNSISWAAAIFIIYLGAGVGSQVVSRGVMIFVITYLIYSIYARLIYQLTISRLSVSIGH